METHVYANDREICSKAADGKSTAFPDVCFSPGPPPPGVPVPYPNTAFAKDLAKGARTVLVKRSHPVCRKNKSYIGTSIGDDPATPGLKKGVVSSKIKGKAYFISWSMNVKAEGLNVTRHQDKITQNHGSPANTPPTVYMDTPDAAAACANDKKKIKEECGPEDEQHNKDKPKRRSSFKRLLGPKYAKHSKTLSKGGTDNTSWMRENCDFLWIKPSATGHEDFLNKIEELKGDLTGAAEAALEELKGKVTQEVLEMAQKKGGRLAARAGAKWVVAAGGAAIGGVGAAFTEAAATIWNIGDTLVTVGSGVVDGYQIYQEIDKIKQQVADFKNVAEELDRFSQNVRNDPQKAAADFMSMAAKADGCARARRCAMVPYGKTDSLTGQGCCPGQTGHHLIPEEMVAAGCPGYVHADAPTICVEGTNNSHGSHGAIHRNLSKIVQNQKDGYALFGGGEQIGYKKARNMAIESFYDTFPESLCDEKCLKAQLDGYYKNKCTGNMKAAAGTAGGTPSPSTSTGKNR